MSILHLQVEIFANDKITIWVFFNELRTHASSQAYKLSSIFCMIFLESPSSEYTFSYHMLIIITRNAPREICNFSTEYKKQWTITPTIDWGEQQTPVYLELPRMHLCLLTHKSLVRYISHVSIPQKDIFWKFYKYIF